MAGRNFTESERRTLSFWLLAGLAGLVCYAWLYPQAFPEAALTLRIGRNEALTHFSTHLGPNGDVL